jgi:uncharacterized protein
MKKNILWTGIEYHSLENCIVTSSNIGTEINSTIIGSYNDLLYKVDYRIATNELWLTTEIDIECRVNNRLQTICLQSDGLGNWRNAAGSIPAYKGCIDVDISITPFTNTLPVNRLQLEAGESSHIEVLYVDVLKNEVKPVQQMYTRLSDTSYRFQTIPNDFEAIVTVDHSGLVLMYPGLFERKMLKEYS